jgi:hypothetical protein
METLNNEKSSKSIILPSVIFLVLSGFLIGLFSSIILTEGYDEIGLPDSQVDEIECFQYTKICDKYETTINNGSAIIGYSKTSIGCPNDIQNANSLINLTLLQSTCLRC